MSKPAHTAPKATSANRSTSPCCLRLWSALLPEGRHRASSEVLWFVHRRAAAPGRCVLPSKVGPPLPYRPAMTRDHTTHSQVVSKPQAHELVSGAILQANGLAMVVEKGE